MKRGSFIQIFEKEGSKIRVTHIFMDKFNLEHRAFDVRIRSWFFFSQCYSEHRRIIMIIAEVATALSERSLYRKNPMYLLNRSLEPKNISNQSRSSFSDWSSLMVNNNFLQTI